MGDCSAHPPGKASERSTRDAKQGAYVSGLNHGAPRRQIKIRVSHQESATQHHSGRVHWLECLTFRLTRSARSLYREEHADVRDMLACWAETERGLEEMEMGVFSSDQIAVKKYTW